MRTINLTITKENHNGKDIEVKTTDLIKACVNNVPQGGLSISEMIKRIRIMDLVNSASGPEIQIEDADFDNLKIYMNAMKWTVVSKAIVEFSNQFK